jgi:hypothetical protein
MSKPQVQPVRADPKEIERAMGVLYFWDFTLIELRVPKTPRDGTVSGYFTDRTLLVKHAMEWNTENSVYVTLNPVNPSLIARSFNRVKRRAQTTTGDRDIEERHLILVDCDPVRPADISSSDVEHEAGLERAREIRMVLVEEGWPPPVLGDSGNGGHLLWRIRLPNDEASAELLKRVLQALAARFNDNVMKIDVTVHNAARIVKLYGTVARKGDSIPERPHRLSRLLEVPEKRGSVERELLEELAARYAPKAEPTRPAAAATDEPGSFFNIETFIARNLKARDPQPYQGGRRWILEICPFNGEHALSSAVFELPADDGLGYKFGFKCQHNSCADKRWRDVRDLYEPRRRWAKVKGAAASMPPAGKSTPSPPPDDTSWPEPSPIGPELPPVKPFRANMLPEAFRETVEDLAERMQVPMDFPAAVAILCLAGAVNRRARIQPKAQDSTWLVVPNLWGGLAAPPGFLKSPVLAAITTLLHGIECMWRAEYESALAEYNTDMETAELRLAAWKEQSKKSFKDGTGVPLRPDVSLVKPTMRRLIIGDATFEKLHELMAENPAGLLVVRDELTGWWAQLDRAGREGERAFCLQAWNGDTGHTIDRIGRGSVFVPACCVSMVGGITPGRLRSYLSDALKDGPANDGLIPAFPGAGVAGRAARVALCGPSSEAELHG